MISRRNIRVKVMQALYASETMEDNQPVNSIQPRKLLQKHFDLSKQLLVHIINSICEVARYVEEDARNRASKHLPSAEDLSVNTKLAGNELLWIINELPSWQAVVKEEKPAHWVNHDLIKKIYLQLVTTEIYQTYIATPSRDKKSEKAILDYIFSELLLPNEDFINHVEELFTNWQDDGEMIVLLVNNFLSKPHTYNFSDLLSEEKSKFAFNLLKAVIEKNEVCMEYIKPKLKNWDAERIAVLDMILMKMGVCEFLFFETIPPKVTINEYIDLAKEYSTPQSGQFINGILDNIHKDLVRDNNLHKISFKPNK